MELVTNSQTPDIHLNGWKLDALQTFQSKMTDKDKRFPCIPAALGFSLGQLRYGFCDDPRKVSSAQTLAILLRAYTAIFKNIGEYTSLIIFFYTPDDLIRCGSVEYFEQLFWKQLTIVSQLDEYEWPKDIPINPNNHLWEYCFHGEPFFMYCATPLHNNRYSRHFPYMMLAITPRWVLQQFNRDPSRSDKLKKQIRKRLEAYDSVPPHPHLNQYGNSENYEWKQYFLHDDETTISACPFHHQQIAGEIPDSK